VGIVRSSSKVYLRSWEWYLWWEMQINFTGMTHALAEITSDSVLQSSCLLQWLCEINSLQLGEGTRMGFVIDFMERWASLQTGMKWKRDLDSWGLASSPLPSFHCWARNLPVCEQQHPVKTCSLKTLNQAKKVENQAHYSFCCALFFYRNKFWIW
jgi:hypothetical protein